MTAPVVPLAHRLTLLVSGLIACGIGVGLMLRSGLGVASWDVLHQGLARHFGLTVGTWSIIVAGLVLIAWLPLRERPGIGTLLDAVLVGTVIDLVNAALPQFRNPLAQVVALMTGIVLTGFGSGLYLSMNLGPGSRDGLMTAIAKRGPSIRLTRTTIEAVVIAVGWLLGGTFGVGTIAFALLIGPIVQFFLGRFRPNEAGGTWSESRGLR